MPFIYSHLSLILNEHNFVSSTIPNFEFKYNFFSSSFNNLNIFNSSEILLFQQKAADPIFALVIINSASLPLKPINSLLFSTLDSPEWELFTFQAPSMNSSVRKSLSVI